MLWRMCIILTFCTSNIVLIIVGNYGEMRSMKCNTHVLNLKRYGVTFIVRHTQLAHRSMVILS